MPDHVHLSRIIDGHSPIRYRRVQKVAFETDSSHIDAYQYATVVSFSIFDSGLRYVLPAIPTQFLIANQHDHIRRYLHT